VRFYSGIAAVVLIIAEMAVIHSFYLHYPRAEAEEFPA
jgi:hypothetical protein